MSRAWISLGLAALVAACATPPAARSPLERVSFRLPALDGPPIGPEDFEGQVVFVDVWATWCRPCEASFPFYATLHERFAERGLVILAVSVDRQDEEVRAYLERRPVPFRVLRDPGGTVPAQIGLATMPTAVLIGREGRVAHVHEGFRSGDEAAIEAAISAELGRGP